MWKYNETMRPNDIMHYGVLGMKWGRRRYQNADGTLTEAGRKRMSKLKQSNEKYRVKMKKLNSKAHKYNSKTIAVKSRNAKYEAKLSKANIKM